MSAGGCALCDIGELCSYSAAGGKWQRSNPECGRVGSLFSDAGAYQVAPGKADHSIAADPATEVESIDHLNYNGSTQPYESIPDEAASYPEGVIILGGDSVSS